MANFMSMFHLNQAIFGSKTVCSRRQCVVQLVERRQIIAGVYQLFGLLHFASHSIQLQLLRDTQ